MKKETSGFMKLAVQLRDERFKNAGGQSEKTPGVGVEAGRGGLSAMAVLQAEGHNVREMNGRGFDGVLFRFERSVVIAHGRDLGIGKAPEMEKRRAEFSVIESEEFAFGAMQEHTGGTDAGQSGSHLLRGF